MFCIFPWQGGGLSFWVWKIPFQNSKRRVGSFYLRVAPGQSQVSEAGTFLAFKPASTVQFLIFLYLNDLWLVSSEDLSVSCMLTAANMSGCLSLTNFHYLNVICITWGTFAGAASSNGAAAQEIRLHADAQHGCFWAAGNDAIWKFLQGAPGCPKKEVTIPNISTSLLRSMSYFTFRTFEDLIYIYIILKCVQATKNSTIQQQFVRNNKQF